MNDPAEGKPNYCLGNWESQSYRQLYKNWVWLTLREGGTKISKKVFTNWFKTQSREDHEKIIWQGVLNNQADIEKHSLILSLSANPLHELLWSHYSDGHRGIALAFDASIGSEFGMALKVNYVQEISPLEIPIQDKEAIFQASILTKRSAWAYEEEYRCVGGKLGVDFKLNEQFLYFNPRRLLGIIFGVNTPKADKQAIIAWSNKRPFPLVFLQATIAVDGSVAIFPYVPESKQ